MALAVVLASVSAVVGLYISFYLNLASGASIVLVETLFFVIALVFGPKTGLLSRAVTPTRGRRAVGSPGGQSAR